MKILITGGAGFIGSHLADALVERGEEVILFDNLDSQVHPGGLPPDYLNTSARFVQGDVRDYAAFREVVTEADIIFHYASAVGVGQSQYQISKYVEVNTFGTANLLHALANEKHSVRKVLLAASMSSYGEGPSRCERCGVFRPRLRPPDQVARGEWEILCPGCGRPSSPVPITEEAAQNCNSIYAITKKNQEEMLLNIGRTYDIPVVALRYFNAFGTRQSLSNPYTGVIAIFMSRLKNDRPPVIYEDGLQTRDFISIHDIVRVNLLAMESDAADYRTFNVGTGKPISIRSVAETLARLCRKDIAPEITHSFRKGDIRHCYADNTAIRQALGFEPNISLEEGLGEIIEWSRHASAEDGFDRARSELAEKGLV